MRSIKIKKSKLDQMITSFKTCDCKNESCANKVYIGYDVCSKSCLESVQQNDPSDLINKSKVASFHTCFWCGYKSMYVPQKQLEERGLALIYYSIMTCNKCGN